MNNLKRCSTDSKIISNKPAFAAVPIRAFSDDRLSGRHWRVLCVIAFHDRLGRNGQGCWASLKQLAQEANLSEPHFSDMASDLRRWGYVTADRNPARRNQIIRRVSSAAYGLLGQQVLPENGKQADKELPVNGNCTSQTREGVLPVSECQTFDATNEKCSQDILKRTINREEGAQGFKQEIAQKRAAEAERYLSDVQSLESDPIIKFEFRKLASIADDEGLPNAVRERAALLRNIARAAA
jgi:DNA-binding MarR family transcriptional regulator